MCTILIRTRSFGYLLHPRIIKNLPSNPRIADIGTGTAIVLRDLATQLTNAQLDGFDISDAQFPKEISSNITLHLANCKKPFPAEFHGKFDVVHLRLLIAAMESSHDWNAVARNAFALLKPGGAIQWMEGQFGQLLPVVQQDLDATYLRLEKLYRTAFDIVGAHRVAWDLMGLESVIENLGMVDAKHEIISSDRFVETRRLATDLQIGACHAILKSAGRLSEQELEKIAGDARRDMESGAYSRCDIHCYTAFKLA